MNVVKKVIVSILAVVFIISSLVACGPSTSKIEKIKAAGFPEELLPLDESLEFEKDNKMVYFFSKDKTIEEMIEFFKKAGEEIGVTVLAELDTAQMVQFGLADQASMDAGYNSWLYNGYFGPDNTSLDIRISETKVQLNKVLSVQIVCGAQDMSAFLNQTEHVEGEEESMAIQPEGTEASIKGTLSTTETSSVSEASATTDTTSSDVTESTEATASDTAESSAQ